MDGAAERKEVEDYLAAHDMQRVMNDAVNRVIKAKAEQPYEDIAEILKKLDKRGILAVSARETLDSEGLPTVEATVTTSRGSFSASVPAEPLPADPRDKEPFLAVELRDGDATRYKGQGVTKAVDNINSVVGPELVGMDPADQKSIDDKLLSADGTANKKNLGANAVLALSIAVARAGARQNDCALYQHLGNLAGNDEVILPVPLMTMLEGGVRAKNKLAFQEVLLIPSGADSFKEAMEIGVTVFNSLSGVIEEKFGPEALVYGKSGAYAPPTLSTVEEALDTLKEAVEKTDGLLDKVKFGLTAGAQRFVVRPPLPDPDSEDADAKAAEGEKEAEAEEASEEPPTYNLNYLEEGGGDPAGAIPGEELSKVYSDLFAKYPLVSVEDPFAKGDWKQYSDLTGTVGNDVQVAGDEILTSSAERLEEAEDKKGANGIVINIPQLGTVTEAVAAVKLAQESAWGVIVSHRLRESADDFIADFAVGLRAGQLKAGPPRMLERLGKYNRLASIEDELAERSSFVGGSFRNPPRV